MTPYQIKAGRLFLALCLGLSTAAIITGITGCVGNRYSATPNHSPAYFKPTWDGDEHAIPVYTSPTVTPAAVTPATNNWTATNQSP